MKELKVTSPAFEDNGRIPDKYAGFDADISPELRLSGLDEKAKSIAVVMNDLDHPIKGYNHWLIWNIKPTDVIPENIPHGEELPSLGAMQGIGYGRHGYAGPKPPFNWRHRYEFIVYVLDEKVNLPANIRRKNLLEAMEGHILQKGALIGCYQRHWK